MTSNPFLAGVEDLIKIDVLASEAMADIGANDDDVEQEAQRSRRGLTITKLNDDEGYWTARLTISGQTTKVDKKFGTWRITPEADASRYRELLPEFCMALQNKVVPIEAARRRAIEEAKKPKPKAAAPAEEPKPDLMAALEKSLKPKTNDMPAGVSLG